MRAVSAAVYIFFAAALELVLARLIEDSANLKGMMYLDGEIGRGGGVPPGRVRRAVSGMLYADDAGVVSTSPDVMARVMTLSSTCFGPLGWRYGIGCRLSR